MAPKRSRTLVSKGVSMKKVRVEPHPKVRSAPKKEAAQIKLNPTGSSC